MTTLQEIRERVLELPFGERAVLARDLVLSLESDDVDADVDAEWNEEIERRSELVHRGEHTAMDWQDSVRQIRQALSKRRAS